VLPQGSSILIDPPAGVEGHGVDGPGVVGRSINDSGVVGESPAATTGSALAAPADPPERLTFDPPERLTFDEGYGHYSLHFSANRSLNLRGWMGRVGQCGRQAGIMRSPNRFSALKTNSSTAPSFQHMPG
jgi:hypothetical protein